MAIRLVVLILFWITGTVFCSKEDNTLARWRERLKSYQDLKFKLDGVK
jgi:hypothetical protein